VEQEEKGFPMTEKTNPLDDDCLAAESSQGADDASALPVRLERYFTAHRRALHMADYAIGQDQHKIGAKLKDCGHWLLFRDYYTAGRIRLHSGKFCSLTTLCPLCAIRRGAKLMKAYLDKLAVIQAEQPGLQAYLVTFTIKNGPDLGERFRHLRGAMRRMTQARRDHLKDTRRPHVEFAKAVGGVHSIESKRGQNSQEWHPHAHMIWLCYDAPDAAKLAEEWKSWTGDSFVVDVRPFTDQDDLVGGFLEVFKYALKFSELPLDDNWQAYVKLKGKRLVDSFGCLRGVEVPEDLNDECLDDMPYVEMLYRYTRAGYSLVKLGGLDVETGEVDSERLSLGEVKFYRD
jgi:hypothetical protein